ncbi:MAG: hypothetical protein ABL952_00195 [Pyrinomonadaceae bacterium]
MSTDLKKLFTKYSEHMLRGDVGLSENDGLAGKMFETLLSIAGPDIAGRPEFFLDTKLSTGTAIAPRDAATCMTDIVRTSRYVLGLRNAVIEMRARFPNQRVDILYAGCGPFAAIALPLCHEFTADEISFTLVDLHEASLASAKRVFDALGIGKFVAEWLCADASAVVPSKKYQIIVAETMQKALEKEPQVAVTIHLSDFLHADGIFLPEKITVTACLADLNVEFGSGARNERIVLGDICTLTKDTDEIEPVAMTIPDIQTDGLSLLLATSIQIFDSVGLGDRESGITHPSIIFDTGSLKPGDNIEFKYRMGAEPRFVCRVV